VKKNQKKSIVSLLKAKVFTSITYVEGIEKEDEMA
jgi:hypothetical protein